MEKPIPGLCIVSRHYPAGGGLSGALAVLGPTRMNFGEVIPAIEYFSGLMGRAINAAGSDARPRRWTDIRLNRTWSATRVS